MIVEPFYFVVSFSLTTSLTQLSTTTFSLLYAVFKVLAGSFPSSLNIFIQMLGLSLVFDLSTLDTISTIPNLTLPPLWKLTNFDCFISVITGGG